jgi:hypothetical protein
MMYMKTHEIKRERYNHDGLATTLLAVVTLAAVYGLYLVLTSVF